MMQTDVSSAERTTSGTAYGAPTRVRGMLISFASAGTVELKDGGSSGTSRFKYTAPAAAGSISVLLPGQGIRFDTDVYAALTNATVTVFYG